MKEIKTLLDEGWSVSSIVDRLVNTYPHLGEFTVRRLIEEVTQRTLTWDRKKSFRKRERRRK